MKIEDLLGYGMQISISLLAVIIFPPNLSLDLKALLLILTGMIVFGIIELNYSNTIIKKNKKIKDAFISSVLYAPLLEETIFRHFIIQMCFLLITPRLYAYTCGITLSSLGFALFHFIFPISNRIQFTVKKLAYYFASGLIFCFLYTLSDYNLLVVIILHAYTNIIVFLSMFLNYNRNAEPKDKATFKNFL